MICVRLGYCNIIWIPAFAGIQEIYPVQIHLSICSHNHLGDKSFTLGRSNLLGSRGHSPWFNLKQLVRPQGTAVRTLPLHTATCEAPKILFHTGITDLKTAGADPTEGLFFAAAAAVKFPFMASFLHESFAATC